MRSVLYQFCNRPKLSQKHFQRIECVTCYLRASRKLQKLVFNDLESDQSENNVFLSPIICRICYRSHESFHFFSPRSLHPIDAALMHRSQIDTSILHRQNRNWFPSTMLHSWWLTQVMSKSAPPERYTHEECSRFLWSFNFMHLDTDSRTHF